MLELKKTPARALGVVAASAALVFATAVSATAGYDGTYAKNGVKIRTGPHTTSTLVGTANTSQDNCLFFYTSGTVVDGDPYWWYHVNYSTSKRGYTAEPRIRIYSPIGYCYDV